ncbi:MAG: bifunctional nuclease family protein, partial [Lachnospiraceae bacterium]|nr:bifunctional nuclease family protein [Lachnospiraceae bacterium]
EHDKYLSTESEKAITKFKKESDEAAAEIQALGDNGIIEGKYRAILYNTKTFDTVSIRVSDAVLLSYISKIPIYIDELLMEKQSVKYEKESNGVSIPLNAMSMELLNSALSKAIAEEKYELASHLRDEIRRRK